MKGIIEEGGLFDAEELIKAIDKALSLYETDGGYLSRADITAILNSQQRIRQGTCIIVSNPYPRTDYERQGSSKLQYEKPEQKGQSTAFRIRRISFNHKFLYTACTVFKILQYVITKQNK